MICGGFVATAIAAFGYGAYQANLKLDKIENKIADDQDEFKRKVMQNIDHNLGKIREVNGTIIKLNTRVLKIEQKLNLNSQNEIEIVDTYFSDDIPDHTNWNL